MSNASPTRFQSTHCELCGDHTQAFVEAIKPLAFSGWGAVPLYWPGNNHATGSKRLCPSHAERERRITERTGSPYASDKRSLNRHAFIRGPLLDRLAMRYPILHFAQARQRALLYLCSPIKCNQMRLASEDEIAGAIEARAELLRLVLGLRSAANFRKLRGLSRLRIDADHVTVQIDHRKPREFSASNTHITPLREATIRRMKRDNLTNDLKTFHLDIPTLAGFLTCHTDDDGTHWDFQFWSPRLWHDLHRLVVMLRRRNSPFDPIEAVNQILSA